MSPVEMLLNPIILNQADEEVVHSVYTNSSVAKHLQAMALETIKELLQTPALSTPAETTARAVIKAQGRLETLTTLLSISQIKE